MILTIARTIVLHEGKILLLRNRYPEGEFYGFPGGKQEAGESLEECAVRETKEETNLAVELVQPLYLHEFIDDRINNRHHITLYFLAEPRGELAVTHAHDPDKDENKIQEVLWVPIVKMKELPMRPSEVAEQILHEYKRGFTTLKKLPTTRTIHQQILNLLAERGCAYQLLEHDFVHSSRDAARVRGTRLEEAAKALVLHDRITDEFFMCIVSGHMRLDLKRVKALRGSKNVSLAAPDDVLRVTGCKVGTVPPFPTLLGLEGYCDKGVVANKFVLFSAASHYKSIRMQSAVWQEIAGVTVVEIAKEGKD